MKFIGKLLELHLRRYPGMELADIYKLLHQAALGSGHAVTDPAAARLILEQELATLLDDAAAAPQEPLIDPISPDGKLARVHLRAWRAAGLAPAMLADAFVATAQHTPPAPEKLQRFCACLGDFAQTGEIPFEAQQVRAYFAQIAEAGYPAVHHSPRYREAYRPAYRVVNRDLLGALGDAT